MENLETRIATFAKALSNPTRLAIIKILLEKEKCSCGENCTGENCKCGCKCGSLVERFPMAQSTVSQHIKELKSAGLINISCRKGNYTLNHKIINEGLTSLAGFFNLTLNTDMEEKKTCNCGENCQCGENCNCGDNCQCGENCNCGENCQCGENCNCGENCQCGDKCNCCDNCNCGDDCNCHDGEKCCQECTCS